MWFALWQDNTAYKKLDQKVYCISTIRLRDNKLPVPKHFVNAGHIVHQVKDNMPPMR